GRRDRPARRDLQCGQRCAATVGRGAERDAADAAPPAGGARTRRVIGACFVGRRMKAARFDYLRPSDVGEALAALAKAEGGGKLLAGGQSLGPMLNLRLARPSLLVDVSRLDALARVDDIGSAFRIGAGVTHSRIEDMRGRLIGGEMLCEVAAGIAYRAVRNRG